MDCRVEPGNDGPNGGYMRLKTTSLCIALTLAALTLSACASRNEAPVAAVTEDDDAFCRAGGVAAGSSEYVACRKNRDVQRSNEVSKAARTQRNLNETMINTPFKP
jgi:hypothetical protein